MKPASFDYHRPDTIEDAVALLARFASEEARVIAGGQTLVAAMAMRLARPGHLIDINAIAELDSIAISGDRLVMAACVRHAALDQRAAPGPLGRLLGLAQRHIAHPPIRARGTFCGSLANADAASEWCLVATALDAQIEARSIRGARTIAADAFFLGYMTTTLEPDELITAASLPLLPVGTCVGFYEFARRAGDFAQVMALACYALEGGRIAAPVVAIGALGSRAWRSAEAEAILLHAPPDAVIFSQASKAAGAAIPLSRDDPYLRALGETAVLRALTDAC